MRKLALALVLTGLLTACGSTDTAQEAAPVVTKTVEVQAPAPVQPAGDDMAEMLNLIRTAEPMFNSVDDADIIETANIFCDTLRSGASLEEIGTIAQDTIGVDAAAALGAGAIVYLCPDQEYKLG